MIVGVQADSLRYAGWRSVAPKLKGPVASLTSTGNYLTHDRNVFSDFPQ